MPIKVTKEDFRWTNGRGHDQKPILYSQKKNKDGLGKKQHSSDQWWEKAFDNQLKGLDVTSVGGDVTVKQTARNVKAAGMEKIAKCYIRFVRGGMLQGGKEITGEREGEGEGEGEAEGGVEGEGVVVGSAQSKAGGGEGGREMREKKKEGRRKTKDEKAERRQRKLRKRTVEEEKAERRKRKSLKRMVEREMAVLGRAKG